MLTVAFSLFSYAAQSACSALDSQSDVDGMLYRHHWDLPIYEKNVIILICPIEIDISRIRSKSDGGMKPLYSLQRETATI